MSLIYHYRLPVEQGTFDLELPYGAQILHIGRREAQPTIWILCAEKKKQYSVKRSFYCAYTGENPVNLNKMNYLGSSMNDWNMVFHYFEIGD